MNAEILNIGSEVSTGRIVNTNASFLGQRLTALGLAVDVHTVVPDDAALILTALRAALHRAHIIVVTGGLGPTSDDMTTEIITAFLKKPLTRDRKAAAHLMDYLRKRRRILTLDALKMVALPKGVTPLANRLGMAVGYYTRHHGKHLFVLPGVPHELKEMMALEVEPLLQNILRRSGRRTFARKSLGVFGVAEAQVGQAVKSLWLRERLGKIGKDLSIGYQVSPDEARIVLEILSKEPVAKINGALEQCETLIRERLGQAIFTNEEKSLAQIVHERLLQSGLTLAVAESCTGGMLGGSLTDHAGSSRYFLGGVISYSNESKVRELGVGSSLLDERGAVSEACARAMAEGVAKRFSADIGVAITGIAGPDGGSAEKPVGTVFIALVHKNEAIAMEEHFGSGGGRERIRKLSVAKALNLLRLFIDGYTGGRPGRMGV